MNAQTSIRLGIFILLSLILFAFVAPILSSFEPNSTHLVDKNSAPNEVHPFGTDDLGRDLLVRVASAVRLSLFVGALAAVIDLLIGVLWGMGAALGGFKLDQVLMSIADMLYSIPYLLVVLLLTVVVGQGFLPIFLAMVLVGWVQMARIVRAQTVAVKDAEYVLASRILGSKTTTIFFTHMMPNIIGPILAATVLSIPQAIFSEAFLSFLGIGIQPPQASLGSLVADALPALRYYPWRLFFPAGAITLLVLGLTLLSDGLRDLYDPRQRILKGDIV